MVIQDEKGLKRFYLLVASIVCGVIVLLVGIKLFFTYKSLTGSSSVSDAFSAIYDAVGSVRMGVTVFYIAFMLNLVCIGGYIYRYVKLNDKRKDSLLALGTLGVSEIVALTLMPTMMTLSKIITTIDGINNGTSSLWDLGSAASSFSTNTMV